MYRIGNCGKFQIGRAFSLLPWICDLMRTSRSASHKPERQRSFPGCWLSPQCRGVLACTHRQLLFSGYKLLLLISARVAKARHPSPHHSGRCGRCNLADGMRCRPPPLYPVLGCQERSSLTPVRYRAGARGRLGAVGGQALRQL